MLVYGSAFTCALRLSKQASPTRRAGCCLGSTFWRNEAQPGGTLHLAQRWPC